MEFSSTHKPLHRVDRALDSLGVAMLYIDAGYNQAFSSSSVSPGIPTSTSTIN
jgi:hypothetical protein